MKRVIVVCGLPLLEQGLEKLIDLQGEVQVVGRERALDRALPLIAELRPDVVIVGADDCETALAPLVLRLLREGLCSRVIALNTQDNAMSVYRGGRRVIEGVADLLDVILTAP